MDWNDLRRLYIIFGAFTAFLLSNGSIQVIGVYMTSLGDEFDVGSAMLGWICSLGFAINCMAGNTAIFIE